MRTHLHLFRKIFVEPWIWLRNFHHYHRKHHLTKTTLENSFIHSLPTIQQKYISILLMHIVYSLWLLICVIFVIYFFSFPCEFGCVFIAFHDFPNVENFRKLKKLTMAAAVALTTSEEKWWNVDVAIWILLKVSVSSFTSLSHFLSLSLSLTKSPYLKQTITEKCEWKSNGRMVYPLTTHTS